MILRGGFGVGRGRAEAKAGILLPHCAATPTLPHCRYVYRSATAVPPACLPPRYLPQRRTVQSCLRVIMDNVRLF